MIHKNRKTKKQNKTKPTKRKRAKKAQTTAIVLRSVELSPVQQAQLAIDTPQQFIKQRKIRGGKTANYVEIGYVIAKLNSVVKPPNWSVEVLEQGQTARKVDSKAEGEVWVRVRLTIHDHVKGYKVFKDAYGQHPIHPNVPIGDAFKAAESDAVKKAASMFGVALDVYWNQLDTEEAGPEDKQPKVASMTKLEAFAVAKKYILQENDRQTLMQVIVKLSESQLYTQDQKDELKKLIYAKLEKK